MSQDTKEKKIGGYDVRVTQHPARPAARLLAKVGRVIAPGLSKLGKLASVKDLKPEDVELEDLGPAVAALFEAIDDDQVDALIAEIFKHTIIVLPDEAGQLRAFDLSKGDDIDRAFTGRLSLMFACLKYALEVNFGSFFGANGVLAAIAAAAPKAIPSTSPAS